MKQFTYVITDEVGIHARPAGLLVKKAKELGGKITISGNGKTSDASKLMAVMSMGIKRGMEVTVTLEGGDEDAAAEQMEAFFRENL